MGDTVKIFGSPGTGKTTTLLNILDEKIKEGYEKFIIFSVVHLIINLWTNAKYSRLNILDSKVL